MVLTLVKILIISVHAPKLNEMESQTDTIVRKRNSKFSSKNFKELGVIQSNLVSLNPNS